MMSGIFSKSDIEAIFGVGQTLDPHMNILGSALQSAGYKVPLPPSGVTYSSGMKRSSRKPRFDLIYSAWLRGVARVMTEGGEKYGENNWKLGNEDAAIDAFNHLQDHMLMLKDGDITEEHLLNISCNAMFLYYYTKKFPTLFAEKT